MAPVQRPSCTCRSSMYRMMRGRMRPPPSAITSSAIACSSAGSTSDSAANVTCRPAAHPSTLSPDPSGNASSGSAEEELLAVGELHEVHVDRAVREHAARHVEAQVAVDLPREDLAADGVTHVVRDERDVAQARAPARTPRHVGLREQRVRRVGLRRQAVADHVEHHDAPPRAQHVELVLPVVAARREAVQHECRLGFLGGRRQVDHEHVVAEQSRDAALARATRRSASRGEHAILGADDATTHVHDRRRGRRARGPRLGRDGRRRRCSPIPPASTVGCGRRSRTASSPPAAACGRSTSAATATAPHPTPKRRVLVDRFRGRRARVSSTTSTSPAIRRSRVRALEGRDRPAAR